MRGQKQKYPVMLNDREVEQVKEVVKRGEHTRCEIQRVQMLLWSAEGKMDVEIAALASVNSLSVETVREQWATEKRIEDAPKPGRHKQLDGKQDNFHMAS